MDAIHLNDLAFFAYHGVFDEEARLGQRFLVDLTCWLDLSLPGQTDAYEDTVCYASLVKAAEAAVTGNRVQLLEKLAQIIADAIFDADERIARVSIKVRKPGAPLPIAVGTVSVEITRDRPAIS
ncbi:dihydroneopterin aldolase [Roseibium limicola]|uniref:7,8-dihydroneopterin aldolase n=1 Tax=Roseibium limicola TaxID=2816037 RepID=A0A939ELS1_9HYPH|nr:dihydroneopterin aldolase [Roseibium limicola]MBO0344788.1 dihydroneopterin aldolase [Roseibium limicola]